MEEIYKALSNHLDWNNTEGDCCPYDLSAPLPLKGRPGRLTVPSEYLFNNDLEYLKSSDPEKKYTMSITKTKAARYELVGIEDMIPNLWSATKLGYDKDAAFRIKHWVVRRADRQKYTFKEGDFVNLHLNDIEDMLLLVSQHKLFNLEGSDIVDLAVALRIALNFCLGYNKEMSRIKWSKESGKINGCMGTKDGLQADA
ncbi:hypothetical protein Tco_1353395 [Tanacetum coccineum]